MLSDHDELLTRAAVCIQFEEQTVGSGILYYHPSLGDHVYVLTAAHCLFSDSDKFLNRLGSVSVLFYSPSASSYFPIICKINYNLVSAAADYDVAVLIFDRDLVEKITGRIPRILAVQERQDSTHFVCKGFPVATKGKELVCIMPEWAQHVAVVDKFQLLLKQDFSTAASAEYAVAGFSGSGIFLVDGASIFLFGIFTRFLDPGKLIYSQYLSSVNQLLKDNFLAPIRFTFFSSNGLTPEFFQHSAEKAIEGLGPRHNGDLNFQLPIVKRFHALAKDSYFKQALTQAVDRYLTTRIYASRDNQYVKEIVEQYLLIHDYLRNWLEKIDWSARGSVSISEMQEFIQNFNQRAQEKLYLLYQEETRIAQSIQGKMRSQSFSSPLHSEISWVYQMQDNNRQLLEDLAEVDIDLCNSPFVLLKGEAGAGKSHLLGDMALHCNGDMDQPFVLLLGQHFVKERTIWSNILEHLNLKCTPDVFMKALDHIGRQIGSRVVIAIDAINEGAGKLLWRDSIAGFIQDLKRYPYIGLVISIRTTYWQEIIPGHIQTDTSITKITHEGFSGHEYAALKAFCEYYGVTQPHVPLLIPEYSRPLFLNLIFKGIEASGSKVFPEGFQGLSQIFNLYTKAFTAKLTEKRKEYGMRPKLIQNVIEQFTDESFQQQYSRSLPLEEVLKLFEVRFFQYPYLLSDLIEEGLLIRFLSDSLHHTDEEEMVYFSYERLGDFLIAKRLLSNYTTPEQLLLACKKSGPLGKLVGNWRCNGIMECFAVLMPEQFNLEIVEAYAWVFENHETVEKSDSYQLNSWLLAGFKWRSIESFDLFKIAKWKQNGLHFQLDDDEELLSLVELTGIKNHPFNSDCLSTLLFSRSMAERDGFWQSHMRSYLGKNDEGIAQPITRLINWAWQDGISQGTDRETARLCGQTLCWLLSSTIPSLRDQTTKALVNLLQDQTEALLTLMDTFKDIDDFYILERIYAVAYGCSLRTNHDSAKLIAQAVYDQVFLPENPPEHILLRDYARSIIEYAAALRLPLDADFKRIRPPYRSKLPIFFSSEEELKKKYEINVEDPEYREEFGSAANAIIHSVFQGDFAIYKISSSVSSFVSKRFTFKDDYNAFLSNLPRGGKSRVAKLKGFAELSFFYSWEGQETSSGNNPRLQKTWASLEKYYQELLFDFKSSLKQQQKEFFDEQVIPHWESLFALKKGKDFSLNSRSIQSWVADRVFELGYNYRIHGKYDSIGIPYSGRFENKIERIGKKYQWIAFYQILAKLSDHYKIKDNLSHASSGAYYNGPWDFGLRNLDPSFLTKVAANKSIADEFDIVSSRPNWWDMEKYDYWNRKPEIWIKSINDLPDPTKCIFKKDDQDTEWIYLKSSHTWKNPRPVGDDRRRLDEKEIWYNFQAYLIRKGDFVDCIDWLSEKNFSDFQLPQQRSISQLFSREHFWSPISKQQSKETTVWHRLAGSSFKVMLATENAVGEVDKDKSGAHYGYLMPCQKIFEGLMMKQAVREGDFNSSSDQLVMIHVAGGGCMIQKDYLFSFLKANKLEIFWTLNGEKNVYNKTETMHGLRKSLSGVYHFKSEKLVGSLTIND